MPPVVHGEEIAGLPSGAVGHEEPNAVVDQTLHLVGVHHGVDAPDIVGVGLDRLEAGVQRLAVAAGFLQPERRHRPHELGVGIVGVDLAKCSQRAIAQALGIAEEEVELMTEHEGEQIGRPVGPATRRVAVRLRSSRRPARRRSPRNGLVRARSSAICESVSDAVRTGPRSSGSVLIRLR